MSDSVWAHLKAALGLWLAAHLWPAVTRYFSSGPVLIVGLFWAIDWVLGSYLAWRSRQWSPARSARSVGKLIRWSIALVITAGMRDSGYTGLSVIASMGELVILTSEGSSVFRNLSLLAPEEASSKLLGRFADSVEGSNPLTAANGVARLVTAHNVPDRAEANQIKKESQDAKNQ